MGAEWNILPIYSSRRGSERVEKSGGERESVCVRENESQVERVTERVTNREKERERTREGEEEEREKRKRERRGRERQEEERDKRNR